MPLIAKDLVYRYAGAPRPTLDGFALDLAPGRVVALCGAARSGRSTALAALAGLLAPQQGQVLVDAVRATAPEARGRVGLLLQNADEALFGLTVREDVMFGPLQLGLTPEEAGHRADVALQEVGLQPAVYASRSPFSLSGGQRRRAAIAGLLAMQPSYLLFDEPFAGLDPQGRRETAEVIRASATQGFGQHTGILVALADLELALGLAETLLIMHGGHVVWSGAVADFVAAPPGVERWGLRLPELVALAARLRERGWMLPLTSATPAALAAAIAAHLREVAR